MNDVRYLTEADELVPSVAAAIEDALRETAPAPPESEKMAIQDFFKSPRSLVLKVTFGGDTLAIKLVPANPSSEVSLEREANRLIEIGKALSWSPERIRYFGRAGPVFCLATRWVAGPSLAKIAQDLRQKASGSVIVDEISKAAGSVYALNHAGWYHRDLQPAHLIRVCPDTYELIDFGESGRIDAPGVYCGAFAHFVSRSVARQMIEKRDSVVYSEADEVFAFVATAFAALYGQVIWDYGPFQEKGFLAERLARIADADHVGRIADIAGSDIAASVFIDALENAELLSWERYGELEARLRSAFVSAA